MKNEQQYFEVIQDGIYSSIRITTERPKKWKVKVGDKVHNCTNDIYPTFDRAKKALIKYHRQRMSEYKMAIGWATSLTEQDI